MSRVSSVLKADRAVAEMKGATAEGGSHCHLLPGHSNKIRLTVAFAESYVLIVDIPAESY